MRRIDRERSQQWKHVSEKIVFEPGLLGARHVRAIDQHDTGRGKLRPQFTPLRLLILHESRHSFGDPHQLLGGSKPLRAPGGDPFAHLGAKAGRAHHEKFVEIVG